MTLLYPKNDEIFVVKYDNYFHQNDIKNYLKTREKYLENKNATEDKSTFESFRLKSFYYAGKTGEALNFIKSYYPIFLSDTLSSNPYKSDTRMIRVSAILKHSGNLKQANHLAEIYCNKVNSEFKHNGDLKKEKLEIIHDYSICACLSGNGKLASEIIEEYYFNRKSKASTYDGVLNNMITDLISDTPEFKELKIRIKEDINTMRNNAITFLKTENAWLEDR